jgi:hypothetical protein
VRRNCPPGASKQQRSSTAVVLWHERTGFLQNGAPVATGADVLEVVEVLGTVVVADEVVEELATVVLGSVDVLATVVVATVVVADEVVEELATVVLEELLVVMTTLVVVVVLLGTVVCRYIN